MEKKISLEVTKQLLSLKYQIDFELEKDKKDITLFVLEEINKLKKDFELKIDCLKKDFESKLDCLKKDILDNKSEMKNSSTASQKILK